MDHKFTKEYWDTLTDDQKWEEIDTGFQTALRIAMKLGSQKEILQRVKEDLKEMIEENNEHRKQNEKLKDNALTFLIENEYKQMPFCWYCENMKDEKCSECKWQKSNFKQKKL